MGKFGTSEDTAEPCFEICININQVILNGTQKSLFSCPQDVSQPAKNKTLNLLFFENTFSSVSATSDLNRDLDRNIHELQFIDSATPT